VELQRFLVGKGWPVAAGGLGGHRYSIQGTGTPGVSDVSGSGGNISSQWPVCGFAWLNRPAAQANHCRPNE
jgi:hypothetical protein